MLKIDNLSVSVGNKTILKNLNFKFETGKIYAVMGPNGSGKSTLAYTIMGHPNYVLDRKSKIIHDKKNITALSADKRAKTGIFLSFQQPVPLRGIRVSELIQLALSGQRDPLQIKRQMDAYAKDLKIPQELLDRSLNDGASGGEKKKLEVLQAAVLDKKLLVFDEVDTGVDVDALRTIARFLDKHRRGKTYIIITHYNRILHFLKPDKVLVIINGELTKVGDHRLANYIEKEGYEKNKS